MYIYVYADCIFVYMTMSCVMLSENKILSCLKINLVRFMPVSIRCKKHLVSSNTCSNMHVVIIRYPQKQS